MKLRNLALALTAATLLPTFAYAGDNTDAIRASFEREYNLGSAIHIALPGEPDQILASFERDMYREPAALAAVTVTGDADPLAAIFTALRDEETDQVRASFERDMNRGGTV